MVEATIQGTLTRFALKEKMGDILDIPGMGGYAPVPGSCYWRWYHYDRSCLGLRTCSLYDQRFRRHFCLQRDPEAGQGNVPEISERALCHLATAKEPLSESRK